LFRHLDAALHRQGQPDDGAEDRENDPPECELLESSQRIRLPFSMGEHPLLKAACELKVLVFKNAGARTSESCR
jgi:hypothetical protein